MKNLLFPVFTVAIFATTTILGAPLNPQGLPNDDVEKGSQQTRTETSECPSGIMRFCAGSGDLCELTIGWDCEKA